eukprot:TRINITY_DN44878_c0_g1_i2.p1 TRINITY_DN44878_c0_g1~~TRINITY_DN44878_c0_g1_i2.p1  ORF type:complete len:190 (-),score=22.65 TRINITY_DN44878_c0_g1_i2:199-696(-)
MAMATHGTRATFRSVSVRQPVRTTLQKASYTRWQMMPAPAWCADNKERLEQLPKEFEAMTVDIFKDPSVSTPDDDQAAYVPHEREMSWKFDEIGADVVFKFVGGSHPADSGGDYEVKIQDAGSKVPVYVDGDQLKEGEERPIKMGCTVKFDDVPFQVMRDVRVHA